MPQATPHAPEQPPEAVSSGNRGNHTTSPHNDAQNGSQRAALGHVFAAARPLAVGGEEAGASPPRYDAILVQPGWIRNADGTDSDWLIPADVLHDAADRGLFDALAHYVDHPELFGFGWHQSPSVRDLGGVITDARWDPELNAVRGTIRLYDTEAGQLMRTLYDQILADRTAGLDVPRIGLSIAAYRKYKFDKESGKKVWTHIKKLDSVDLVYEPGAAGYVRQALSTQGGNSMPEEITLEHEENPTPEPVAVAPEPPASEPVSPASDRVDPALARIQDNINTLHRIVGHLSTVVADQAQHSTIQGMGEPPRTPGYLYGGRDSLDRVSLAVDAMLSGTRPPDGVRPLTGIRELYMLLSGDYELTGRFNSDRVYLANVNTSTMANIVADALNKRVVNIFQTYDQWWRPGVTIQDFSSLQDVKWITLGGVGELPTVAEGAAYTEMTWDDQKETASFIKKGGYLGITLETIDKDDTSRVMAAPRALAQAAWMTLGKAIAAIFSANSGTGPTLSDSVALFASGHSNLGTTALSSAAWVATRVAMMKQTELNSGERLGALTRPRLLWVPIDLEDTALQVLAVGEGTLGSANYAINVEAPGDGLRERLRAARERVITVPFWTDTNDWAAQADPNLYPSIGLAFRYGRTPEIFSVADPRAGLMFTNDTMPVKVRFFYAVGPTDYRGLYKHNVT